MIKTAIGLPNTCSQCGKRCINQWWAEHEDAARSGSGLCDGCAQPAAPTTPVRYEPVGETLTRVQSPSAKRGKVK